VICENGKHPPLQHVTEVADAGGTSQQFLPGQKQNSASGQAPAPWKRNPEVPRPLTPDAAGEGRLRCASPKRPPEDSGQLQEAGEHEEGGIQGLLG
jgi:hypothetical protein